jgi:hypothetical protein
MKHLFFILALTASLSSFAQESENPDCGHIQATVVADIKDLKVSATLMKDGAFINKVTSTLKELSATKAALEEMNCPIPTELKSVK